MFPTTMLKAAPLAHSIATTHPFIDGNKRTAYLAAASLLEEDGLCVTAGAAEIEETMMRLVAGELDLEGFAAWLEANSVPLEG